MFEIDWKLFVCDQILISWNEIFWEKKCVQYIIDIMNIILIYSKNKHTTAMIIIISVHDMFLF